MEPEVKRFLKLIAKSIALLICWMLLNTWFGIKMGLLFLDEKITAWHGVYYVLMIASFTWLLYYVKKMWKGAPDFDDA